MKPGTRDGDLYYLDGPTRAVWVEDIWPLLCIADFLAAGLLRNVGIFRAMPKSWLCVEPSTLIMDVDDNDLIALVIGENVREQVDNCQDPRHNIVRDKLSIAMMMRGIMSADQAMMQATSSVQRIVEVGR